MVTYINSLSIFIIGLFKKVIIAGHSMGTRLAIDIASKIKKISGLRTI